MDDKQKKELIESKGWYTLWNEDNWVHPSMTNKDYCGVDIDSASKLDGSTNSEYNCTWTGCFAGCS